MDDPIFDPWPIGQTSRRGSGETSSRRARGGLEVSDDPLDASRARVTDEPAGRRWVVPVSGSTKVRAPIPRPKSPPGQTLQGVARPRLEEVQARLQIAGHVAVLVDLTDRHPPSLRLRFVPRRGPFDEVATVDGAVFELTWNDDAGHAAARFWLDPLARECTEEVTAHLARVDGPWVDRVVLEFVDKTLRASV